MGTPLGYLILFAYFPMALQRQEHIAGAPPWIWKDKFDFVAKVASEDIEEWQKAGRPGFGQSNALLETMLQAALAERCQLIVHRVPATMSGFALIVTHRGVRSKRFSLSKPDELIPDNAQPMPKGGKMVPILSHEDPTTHFYATSTASLAAVMSNWGAPVEDRTGLTGKYDFALTRLSTTNDPSVDWDIAALGLKLEPIKVQTEIIQVDHIERPSPN